ncbi:MAG: ribulose-phosphate 3-epimerase, partial [Anaerolineae bacterium]|nr:ribulose-phosphate 3-epimerase [Anaerolineae bacterium]
ADLSLWSCDLANLAVEIRHTEPFADLYHLDVADGHFVSSLLFFPDLVAAIRPLTRRPFHVHLMVEHPTRWIGDFAEAGADIITIHHENEQCDAALEQIRALGLGAGLAVQLETPIDAITDYVAKIDLVVLLGTRLGIKGAELHDTACPRIVQLRALLHEQGRLDDLLIQADGGIRQHTVPQLRAAGADIITPGSLVFKSDDLDETMRWLRALPLPND